MCYTPYSAVATTNLVDEKQPLIEKQFDKITTTATSNINSLAASPFQRSSKTMGGLLNLLNRLSYLVALIGIVWYSILLSQGEYSTWAMPLFVAATVCKLVSTSPRCYYKSNNNNNSFLSNYWSQGESSVKRRRSITMPLTAYERLSNYIARNTTLQNLNAITKSLKRRLSNDNHSNVIFLSSTIILLPCLLYFAQKVLGHLSDFKEAGQGIKHEKLANDFGKLGSAALSFLLLPVSKHSPIFRALKLSEVHMIRLHITAGCLVLFGGIGHGLYYTYIWIKLDGYNYQDVFPMKGCWVGLRNREYDKECHSKFVNLLGIISGVSLLILGLSSLYWIRRRCYKMFYYIHITVSVIVTFGLVMHYNKMIWYLAPSLLVYLASNLPVAVESLYKWWRLGGVKVSKVVCIPDSGGCVELSLLLRRNDFDNGMLLVRGDDDSEDYDTNSANRRVTDEFQAFHDTIGKYIKLQVPELSLQSHPFTIFTNPDHPNETIQILFRPHGSFTKTLSKRLRSLTLLPEPTPSEIENHQFLQSQRRGEESACPKMLVNGIRCGTTDMYENVSRNGVHDRIVIIAGGVGIVSYISLLHAIRLECMMIMEDAMKKNCNNNGEGRLDGDHDSRMIVNNHRRLMFNDGDDNDDDLEGGFDQDHLNNVRENGNGVLDGGSAAASADDADAVSHGTKQRCIDVHWMSRDEGLIRHVLENYLEPFCSYSNDGSSASSASCPISINVVVHHTSPHYTTALPSSLDSRTSQSTTINNGNNFAATSSVGNDSEPTTWQPGRGTVGTPHSTTTSLFAFPTSTYEGGTNNNISKSSPSITQNVLPAITQASIVFGGLWIVNYCFNNIQDKHVVETRPISVIGVLILAIAVSVASNAIVLVSSSASAFYSKLFSSYTKLEGGGNESDRNLGASESRNSEIEVVGQVGVPTNNNIGQQQFASDDDANGVDCALDDDHHTSMPSTSSDDKSQLEESPIMTAKQEKDHSSSVIMRISHSQGRPNLGAIVGHAMNKKDIIAPQHEPRQAGDERRGMDGGISSDVGIFMCGPTAMSNSVLDAVKKEEKKVLLCKGGGSSKNRTSVATVYQESFEL